LCCNGVLFADVRRELGDNSPLFTQHGARVAQPCPAFNQGDCTCALYAERPARCRQFECKQLIAVRSGATSAEMALKKIRQTRKLAGQVEQLLEELGFNEVRLPLSRRFQRCQRVAERGGLAEDKLDCLAELQLAVHKLNGLLAADFYA
jgi:Fe-S-cluster containining protein